MKYKEVTKDKCIRVRLDDALWYKLSKYCESIEQTRSAFIRSLISAYIAFDRKEEAE